MKKFLLAGLFTALLLSSVGCSSGDSNEELQKEIEALQQQISELQNAQNTGTSASFAPATSAPISESNPTPSDNLFDQSNILSFVLSNDDRTSSQNGIYHTYTVTNNGSYALKYNSIDVVYYDANNNIVEKDSRYNDVVVLPGQSVDMRSYINVEGDKDKIARSEVVAYEYTTTEPSSLGYNNFEVNLQTKEVEMDNED